MKGLALLLLLPSLAFAGPIGLNPTSTQTAPRFTATAASGSVGFGLLQGARLSLNYPTNTAYLAYDGTDIVIDLPASKGFEIEVNNTDVFDLTSAGALTTAAGITATTGNVTATVGDFVVRSTAIGHVFMVVGPTGTGAPGYNSSAPVTATAGNAAWRYRTDATISTDGVEIMEFWNNNAQASAVLYTGELIYNTGGSADVAGRAVLVGGTVTVNTTAVEADSIILLTRCATGGTEGTIRVGTVTADTSFVIESSNGSDTSTVCWQLAQQN